MRRLPLLPTLVVALAVATMIALGFWQIRRGEQKEALLAQLRAAQNRPPIAYPQHPVADKNGLIFRRAYATCQRSGDRRTIPGRSMAGEIGYVHVVRCATAPSAQPLSVAIGWSKNPNASLLWRGGEVQGVVAEDSHTGFRIVAEQPAAGFERVEPPTLESIPNNHRGYVVTWFSFAGIALIIYGLALRARWRDGNADWEDKRA